MPRIRSAIKRVQVTERNRLRNAAYKSSVRTAMKKVMKSLGKVDATTLTEAVNRAFSLIDRAVLKGVLHKNAGARYKSRLAKAVQKTAA